MDPVQTFALGLCLPLKVLVPKNLVQSNGTCSFWQDLLLDSFFSWANKLLKMLSMHDFMREAEGESDGRELKNLRKTGNK